MTYANLRAGAAGVVVLGAMALAAIAAFAKEPPPAPLPPPAANLEWNKLVEAFEAGYFKLEPSFAVMQGRHEFDGQLPAWDAGAIKREIDWLAAERDKVAAFPVARLAPAQRFEQRYLLAVIDGNLFWLREAEAPFVNPAYYAVSLDPDTYLSRPYAPIEKRMQAFITYAKNVPRATRDIRANLRTPLPETFIQHAIGNYGGFADFYRNEVPELFAAVAVAPLQAELKAAINGAAGAMQELTDWFKSQQATATQKYALGAERFVHMLRATEQVDTPLPRLTAIGQADLRRNLAALDEACRQFAPRAPVKDCVARMRADKPKDGTVAAGVEHVKRLRQFVIDHKLVTIPSDEMALVHEAPAYSRANLAYINTPGPYDKGMPSTYFIAPPDPKWSKADRDAYLPGKAFLEFVSVHEVWPGHFLQFLHANQSATRSGQLFVGYAFAEGWAHYSEEMMWDAGLDSGAPETHVGQLVNALMRDVRFLCAIGLHTTGMTVAACETMFRDQAFLDPGNARQQAARGTYDPAYLNYTMGKLMIRKLRDDWTATRGGRAAWRAFHDQLLSYGGPPIPLVREQMMSPARGELF